MENDLRISGIRKSCNAKCSRDFEKIVELKDSGLDIYVHGRNYLKTKDSANKLRNENVIVHNTSERNLKRFDFVRELCGYKTKCSHCKLLLQRIRSLLNEIKEIKPDDILGICKYCRKANTRNKCRKCEYIVTEFKKSREHEYENRETRTKTWLSKLKTVLESTYRDKSTCKQNMSDDSIQELKKILKQLDNPLFVREPQLSSFLNSAEQLISVENVSDCHDTIQKIISNLRAQSFVKKYQSDDSLFVSASDGAGCICKYFASKEAKTSVEVLLNTEEHLSTVSFPEKENEKQSTDIEKHSKETKSKGKDNKKHAAPKKGKAAKLRAKSETDADLQKEEKLKKPVLGSEDILLLKMMKDREKVKQQKEKFVKETKMTQLPSFGKLPTLKVREKHEEVDLSSDRSLQCGGFEVVRPKEMIRCCKIVPFSLTEVKDKQLKPIFFKTEINCQVPLKTVKPRVKEEIEENIENRDTKTNFDDKTVTLSGIVKYQLSNKEFIEKGWTKLPTTKVMRKINIYKMLPANPDDNWFEKNKLKKLMYYNSGEILAEIDDMGYGRWFYKNGNVALHYYKAQERLADQRYVVYSCGENVTGKSAAVTLLAAFDYLGNGIIYDNLGNARLKYNQFEGMVYDSKIAPISRWKWHDLNDPPLLETVFIDTYERNNNSIFPDLSKEEKDTTREPAKNPEMSEIELQNHLKEKSDKLMQKFRPFQIRMKIFKINEQFSLRVIDQTNIYLIFRYGTASMKLNLGMLLINNEIIDTETVDVSEVGTPYDRIPPKSQSVADLQQVLLKTKKRGKTEHISQNLNVMDRFVQTRA